MKQSLKTMSLSLILVSPLALSIPALAQVGVDSSTQTWQQVRHHQVAETPLPVVEGLRVSQDNTEQQEWDAYASSGYSYWDAKILANFWGQNVGDAKSRIGRKMLWGAESKVYLEQQMVDARVKALGSVEQLELFGESGFSYDDAEALAKLWGDPSPWESKLRIETNLIMGNEDVVRNALSLAKPR
jgi:hypothetical protein